VKDTSLTDIKKFVGELLSKPPFDMVDCSTINFMRNDAHNSGKVEQDVTFFDESDNITFTAQITCGHSPMGLRAPAVLWALQEYTDRTGQHAQWSRATVHPHFNITEQQLNEAINSRELELQTFLGFLTERDLQPLHALKNSIDLVSKTSQNGVSFTPRQFNLAFLPVHTALLSQSKSCKLQDIDGQDIKTMSKPLRLLNRARQRLSFR
jgi:hypothetical protein